MLKLNLSFHRYARFNKSKPQPPRPKSSIEQRMVPSGGGGGYPGEPIQGHPNMHDQWADDYNLERMRRLSLRQQEETVQASNQVQK